MLMTKLGVTDIEHFSIVTLYCDIQKFPKAQSRLNSVALFIESCAD